MGSLRIVAWPVTDPRNVITSGLARRTAPAVLHRGPGQSTRPRRATPRHATHVPVILSLRDAKRAVDGTDGVHWRAGEESRMAGGAAPAATGARADIVLIA